LDRLLQRPGVTAPVGASTLDQFEQNLGAVDWDLTEAERGLASGAPSEGVGAICVVM
jgi:aryl-alcohol dehydrogenase-like predicted oxidoreductase